MEFLTWNSMCLLLDWIGFFDMIAASWRPNGVLNIATVPSWLQ